MKTIRDCLWIWGHPVNSLMNCFGLAEESCMSPAEGAAYLGARNVFYVPMGREADRTKLNRCMTGVQRVGWSIENAAQVDGLVAQSRLFPNVDRGIFDDFFTGESETANSAPYSVEQLFALRGKLHTEGPRPLSMWMVFYTKQFDKGVGRYMEPFDGVTMWFWTESDVPNFDARLEQFLAFTPGKRRMIGCYLYNFGENRQATAESVRFQLDKDRELLKRGVIEGVVLHTNAVADLGYEAVEAAREWVALHGDETV